MTTRGDDPSAPAPRPVAPPTLLDADAPPAAPDDGPLTIGSTFADRYHVKRRVGTGGMGAVYQAFDTVLSEDVAIKLIRPEILADPAAAADIERRFKRELLMGRRVSDPRVVRVHDLGAAEGLRYLTMSYVDGRDLARVLDDEGAMSPARVLRIGRRLGTALVAVHAAGVIHRDLKPANVMLGRGDQVWLTDFGIARLASDPLDAASAAGEDEAAAAGVRAGGARLGTLTTFGARIGTPEYMAPEQADGRRVDERTDVYALALILYDLLTGGARRTRYANAESELQARGVAAPHVRVLAPEVPEALDAVLARALDPDPAGRYSSAASFVDALVAIEEDATAATGSAAGVPAMRSAKESSGATNAAGTTARHETADGTAAPGTVASSTTAPSKTTSSAAPSSMSSSSAARSGAAGVPAGAEAAGATSTPNAAAAGARTRRTLLAIVVVLAAVAIAGFFAVRGARDEDASTRAAASAPSATGTAASGSDLAPATPVRSVAVLAFADLSPQRDQEYLADGLADELINELSRIPDLRVPGRTSSFYFKGKSVPLAEMSRALGVAHVLEGTVRKSGDRLRIGATLVRASDGKQLWSKTFDRAGGDVFAIQDEIAAAVAWALMVALPAQIAHERPANAEAFDLYLRAQTVAVPYTLEAQRAGAELLRRAIALDPKYAAAWSDLAAVLSTLADITKRDDYLREAREAADRAIALAPDRALGYLARASITEMHAQDWASVRRDLDRAASLEPRDNAVQLALAYSAYWQGRVPEAIEAYERVLEVDPLKAGPRANLGYLLSSAGRYAEARRSIVRALELNPDSPTSKLGLGEIELLEGRPDAALATFRSVEDEAFRLYGIAIAEHSRGDRARSDAALRELIAKNSADAAYQIAAVYAWRGERDRAFEWLERARVQRDGGLLSLLVDPIMRPLHADPRWARFVERVGLAADWSAAAGR